MWVCYSQKPKQHQALFSKFLFYIILLAQKWKLSCKFCVEACLNNHHLLWNNPWFSLWQSKVIQLSQRKCFGHIEVSSCYGMLLPFNFWQLCLETWFSKAYYLLSVGLLMCDLGDDYHQELCYPFIYQIKSRMNFMSTPFPSSYLVGNSQFPKHPS